MTKRLNKKRVLVTGASSGIGREIAILFAKEGADLCLVARRYKPLAEVAAKCRGFGANVFESRSDITDQTQVQKMARECIAAFEKIDILINNAGYGMYAPFVSTPIEEWDRMWRVNVRGTVLVTQAIIPCMIYAQNGHIVNISSIHGIQTSGNASAYCATKFAVTGFSEALSKELWKDGIKVSTICPGGVLTDFMGIASEEKNKEFLEAEEVAKVVAGVVTAPGKTLVMQVVVVPKTRPFMVQEII
jgi:short-subunit dehydrogenase